MDRATFTRAMKAGQRATKERIAQSPDYEWVRIRHERKMRLRSYGTMARALDSLYEGLTGNGAWGQR